MMVPRKKIRSFAITAAILGILIYAGFSGDRTRHGVERHETARYIKAIYSIPPTLDPTKMVDTVSLLVGNLIYDGLLSFTSDLELRGALAESWSTSEDGRRLRFKLRANAHFHDGTRVTAQDVVRSLEHAVAPQSQVYTYYDCIAGADAYHAGKSSAVTGLRAIGQDGVEIILRYPFPPFLSILAGATAKVLPAASFLKTDFFTKPVGSGPFELARIEKHEAFTDLVFHRFKDYYAAKPQINELILRAMDEKEALRQAQAGIVQDLANFPLNGAEDVFRYGHHMTAPVAATWIIGLNTRTAPFKDARSRRAFRASVDSEEFRRVFHPDAIPAFGYAPPGTAGFRWTQPHQTDDSARDEIRGRPASTRIRIAIPKLLAKSDEIKRFLESSLRKKGWNVEAVPMEWDALMKAYTEKKLQAFLLSMNMDYPDTEFLVRNFESTNPDNFSGLHDPSVDAMVYQARATQDRIVRQKIYTSLLERIDAAAVTINLFHPRGHYWLHDCVRDLEPNVLADLYIDYRNVWLDPACLAHSTEKVAGL